jgi:hypothetical protein
MGSNMRTPIPILVNDDSVVILPPSGYDPDLGSQIGQAITVANNVAFYTEDGIIKAEHFDGDEGAMASDDRAVFASFGRHLNLVESPQLIATGFEAVFQAAFRRIGISDTMGQTVVLILPYRYNGDIYHYLNKALMSLGISRQGTTDGRSALCMYLVQSFPELREQIMTGDKKTLVIFDCLSDDMIISITKTQMMDDSIHVAISDIIKEKDLAGPYFRRNPQDLIPEVDRLLAAIRETDNGMDSYVFVTLGEGFTRDAVWEQALAHFGDSVREEGRFVSVSKEIEPLACAAGLFASRFAGDPDSHEGLTTDIKFTKKYLFGIQKNETEIEPLADLRALPEEEINGLSLRRKFTVSDATRDVFLILRAGYGVGLDSTFSVQEIEIVKNRDFEGTHIEMIVGLEFINPKQGKFTCSLLNGTLETEKEFYIAF